MTPAHFALAAATLLVCARADASLDIVDMIFPDFGQDRTYNSLKMSRSPNNQQAKAQAHYTENDSKILWNVPNDRQGIAHDSLKARRRKIPNYYHDKVDYTENDRGIQQIVPNDRHDKTYDDTEIDSEIPNDRQDKADDSLKPRRRTIILKDHHDQAYDSQTMRRRIISNYKPQDKAYDTEIDSEIHQIVPNDRQARSYDDLQKTGQMITPNDKQKEAYNTEIDSEIHQVVPNDRQDKAYDSQKTRWRIISNHKPQDKAYDTEIDRGIQQFVRNYRQDETNDLEKPRRRIFISKHHQDKTLHTNNDRGVQQIVPVDHQDESYYDSQKSIRSVIPNDHRDQSYDTEIDSEMHQFLINDRQGKAYYDTKENSGKQIPNDRQDKVYPSGKKTELPSACLYDGRWHSDGTAVSTREDCLRCVCAGGALSCRRRACAPLPDPLPPRCHVRHRRGVCCPELHCPDGVQLMEHGASARLESMGGPPDAEVPTATPATAKNACVEGGSVFAAGSAMASRVACEQCFCLRGARHCVRPSCLPPPAHCAPRPAPGACCPQRYYCDTAPDRPNQHRHRYDCQVGDALVKEGSPVEARGNCSACFCLRGEVRCQALACAPALAGCRPLLTRGDCCAHQYVCDHDEPAGNHGKSGTQSNVIAATVSSPTSTRLDERTLHSAKSDKLESTTKKILTSLYTLKHTSFASATKNHLITTTKVKRKTDEPPLNASIKPEQNTNTTSNNITTTQKPISSAKLIAMPEFSQSSEDLPEKTTEQPEGTVKIMINGTINCTAELSSTSLPLSITVNDTDKQIEVLPRVPIVNVEVLPRIPIVNVEAQTYSPNDIITDRNVNGGFDEDDTFTINVTSSLMTNTSHSTSRPVMTGPKIPIPADLAEALNSSKKKKGEYDYDYTEPTLPPSLPNLKIIPFVAADAVVDDEPTKETLTYPMLEREDKFPVYYPSAATKDTKFPIRREDTYQPTQYPVFVLGKVDTSYPPGSHEVDVPRDRYPERNDPGIHEYTVSASLGSQGSDVKTVTQVPLTSTTFAVETPAVNLFSPPVETEGGFLPKGSGVIDEYFGVYPSTPSGPVVPHLTTSMQLDVIKDVQGECLIDGQHVPGGQSVVLGCQLCTCSWVELTCQRRACAPAAPPCRRLPATNHSRDPCCGDVDCAPEKNTTTGNATVVQENKDNGTKVEGTNTTSESVAVVPLTNNTDTKASTIETVTLNDVTTPPPVNSSVQKTTTTAVPVETAAVGFAELIVSSSAKPTPKLTSTTITPAPNKQVDDTFSEEDEEDDDGSFSFGSVLKLLLSDYETTTAPSKKPSTRAPIRPPPTAPPVRNPSTSPPYTSRPAEETFFKPLPPRPYVTPLIQTNTVNRIDHLVLGEATAIKRTTHRPITNNTTKRPTPQMYERPTPQTYERPTPQTYERPTPQTYERPIPQTYERPTPQTYERPTPQTYERPTPQTYERPIPQTYERPTPQTYERPTPQTHDTTERRPVMQEDPGPFTPVASGGPRPPSLGNLPGVGSGLLKLAGCNIYGRMYRVGRIITELSTPCTECWCTELGVQCKPLDC